MLVVDTSVLVAAANDGDAQHAPAADLLQNADGPLVVPILVVAEASYLFAQRIGPRAEAALARSLKTGGLLSEPVERADWTRVSELLETYEALNIGITDASTVAACERLRVTKLATLDRRHFAAVRPRHCEALELLPR